MIDVHQQIWSFFAIYIQSILESLDPDASNGASSSLFRLFGVVEIVRPAKIRGNYQFCDKFDRPLDAPCSGRSSSDQLWRSLALDLTLFNFYAVICLYPSFEVFCRFLVKVFEKGIECFLVIQKSAENFIRGKR